MHSFQFATSSNLNAINLLSNENKLFYTAVCGLLIARNPNVIGYRFCFSVKFDEVADTGNTVPISY